MNPDDFTDMIEASTKTMRDLTNAIIAFADANDIESELLFLTLLLNATAVGYEADIPYEQQELIFKSAIEQHQKHLRKTEHGT